MKTKSAFSVLEVLIALSILSITLMTFYQFFASSIFVLQSTKILWKVMSETQKELLRWERSKTSPPVSVSQGSVEEDLGFLDGRWKLDIEDNLPLPGIKVRRVNYEITWMEGELEYSYSSDLYVKAE